MMREILLSVILVLQVIVIVLYISFAILRVKFRSGRWMEADDGDGVVCSVCGEDFCNIYLEIDRFKYCPNCGAKMDGD